MKLLGTGNGTWAATLVGLTLLLVTSGCSSKGTDSKDIAPSANEDVALSVASSLADDNGGIADQIKDIDALTRPTGLNPIGKELRQLGWAAAAPTYDPQTGTWEWEFSHEFISGSGKYHALISRSYQWRFKKNNGNPQIAYIVGSDTAYSIELTIVHGDGHHRTPHLSQTLTDLTGNFVATGTNTTTVTVNGTCSRSAVDTVSTHNALRSLNHHTALTLTNVQFRRAGAVDPWESITGTITGTFTADVSFTSGAAYSERSVTREISVTLGQGQAIISFNGRSFEADLLHGELE
ncbi:MAG: hypothetical protein HZB43_09120 [candidate division Zixibacteria bacterium]|nr:hypothetical protein [candidate division Zixibacteria bacterium]